MREFDVVVLGAGAAGEVTAGRLGEHGLSVAIVEQALVGGECSYYACMPSKALLRPVELANEVRRVPGPRRSAPIDVAAVLARRDEVIHDLDDSGAAAVARASAASRSCAAAARIAGERAGRRRAAGDAASRAGPSWSRRARRRSCPTSPGLREARPWTNREATTATRGARRGSRSSAAASSASRWRRPGAALGSQVTLDPPRRAADRARGAVRERAGARRRCASSASTCGSATAATRVARDGAFALELDDGSSVEADELLVAVGRAPGTRGIGLETLGLDDGRAAARSATTCACPATTGCSPIGDVNGRVLLTHMGKYQGRLVADAILGREVAPALGRRALAAGDLHRSAGRRGRAHARRRAARPGSACAHVDVETGGNAGGSFIGRGAPGTVAARRRRGPARRRRRHDHRRRGRRGAARGDDRRRRARSRSTISGTPCRRSRRAASSGCGCSRPTGCEAYRPATATGIAQLVWPFGLFTAPLPSSPAMLSPQHDTRPSAPIEQTWLIPALMVFAAIEPSTATGFPSWYACHRRAARRSCHPSTRSNHRYGARRSR